MPLTTTGSKEKGLLVLKFIGSSLRFVSFNIANYASLCAMKLNVSKKFNCILQMHSFFSNKFTFREYCNMLKTTKVNFEKLLG